MVYQGSKTKYSKYIVPILQQTINDYQPNAFIDAMVGGANIIQHIDYTNKIAYDINPFLIALYQYGQQDIHSWPSQITREDWDKAKNTPEQCEPWFVGLVEFFTSYSARGFCGGYAMNGARNYYYERLRNFEKQLPQLQDISFSTLDYNDIDVEHCVLYFDPPYQGTKAYDYSKKFDYERFWNKMRELSAKNKVFISEQYAPNDFISIWSLDITRNTFGTKIIKATENLFILKEN